jgi:transposase
MAYRRQTSRKSKFATEPVAHMLGVHRNTIGRWLAIYAAGGLDALLATYVPAGKPVSLAPAVLASLEQALHSREGFASYEALRQWVRQTHGVEVRYKTLYGIVRMGCPLIVYTDLDTSFCKIPA